MKKKFVISTIENKKRQKKSVHYSSSAVFFGICNEDKSLDTEVSLLNHFYLKRGITDVVATFEIYNLEGELIRKFKINMNKPKVYSLLLSKYIKKPFIGSIYVFFNSSENLAVPFCAVVSTVRTPNSVCSVHTYGRCLEQKELGTYIELKSTVENGWSARDTNKIKSFAVLHGGKKNLDLDIKLEIYNQNNEKIVIKKKYYLKAFSTLVIVPQDLSEKIINHLSGKRGYIKVYINGISGIFPRMLCGNFVSTSQKNFSLNDANEIQFTHTNFDFSNIHQPDSISNLGYFNQPTVPNGYGIIYPVKTDKNIKIGKTKYINNSMQYIKIDSFSELTVKALKTNLPSRFLCSVIAKWDNAILESECSTGIFTEDYLKVNCYWHWGLLKPGFENGSGVISIFLNRFYKNENLSRILKLYLFNDKKMILEKEIAIDGNIKINVASLLKNKESKGTIWYVLCGKKLEDLGIYSTFYPQDKAGFIEHAF